MCTFFTRTLPLHKMQENSHMNFNRNLYVVTTQDLWVTKTYIFTYAGNSMFGNLLSVTIAKHLWSAWGLITRVKMTHQHQSDPSNGSLSNWWHLWEGHVLCGQMSASVRARVKRVLSTVFSPLKWSLHKFIIHPRALAPLKYQRNARKDGRVHILSDILLDTESSLYTRTVNKNACRLNHVLVPCWNQLSKRSYHWLTSEAISDSVSAGFPLQILASCERVCTVARSGA